MSSGTEIIQAALQRLGAHSVLSPAGPEAIATGRDYLNGMLQSWESIYIDMGCAPLNAPGDELSEPMDARNAIIDNLALQLAPEFDNGKQVVSGDLRARAKAGLLNIKKLYQKLEVPKKRVSSTMPVGAGSSRGDHTSIFIEGNREIDT